MENQIRSITSKRATFLLGALSLLSWFAPMSANAALIDAPLPANAFITQNGFDWAWGANCAMPNGAGCDTIEFSFQASQGWSIAQASDMALAPTALDFLFPGANVGFNSSDPVAGTIFDFTNTAYNLAQSAGACAAAYFTLGNAENSCDWGNGSGQNVNTNGWYNQNGETNFFAEVLFIRPSSVNAVPIPAAAWLFGTALLGLYGFSKRRKTA